MSLAEKMSDLDTFLAYSVALEEEAAERHDELADMMDVHNNPEVAETFRKLAHYSRLHAQEIRDHSRRRRPARNRTLGFRLGRHGRPGNSGHRRGELPDEHVTRP